MLLPATGRRHPTFYGKKPQQEPLSSGCSAFKMAGQNLQMPNQIMSSSLFSNPSGAWLAFGVCAFLLFLIVCTKRWGFSGWVETELSRYPIYVYRSAQRYGVERYAEDLALGNQIVSFNISMPAGMPRTTACYPVIVYLPASAESAESPDFGADLRKFWVEAGYAVIEVSQVRRVSFPQRRARAYAGDEHVSLIRDLLGYLSTQEGSRFARINFGMPVFAGRGAGAHKARALADSYGTATCPASQVEMPQMLFISAPRPDDLLDEEDGGKALGDDLAIFIPKLGDRSSRLRYISDPLRGQDAGQRSSAQNIPYDLATQHLSTGFLDAFVKKDPEAVEWLERDAARWLEPVGEFRNAWRIHSLRYGLNPDV